MITKSAKASILSFQKKWAKEFKKNKLKVLEYWEKYCYLKEINKICKISQKKKILDVGCGISTVLHFIEGEKFGIDPLADEYLKFYNYPKDITIKRGRGEKIPFPDKYFDVVFCTNTLDHVANPRKTIKEIHRVLKEDGYFILMVNIFDKRKKHYDPVHHHCFLVKDIISLIEKKFKIVFKDVSSKPQLQSYLKECKTPKKKEELILVAKKIK